jgi:hypothetical protein
MLAPQKLDAEELLQLFRSKKSAASRGDKGFTAILKAADAIPEVHEVKKDDIGADLLGGYESRTLAGGLEEWEEIRAEVSGAGEPFVDDSFEGYSALVSGTGREKEKYKETCKKVEKWGRVWDLTSQVLLPLPLPLAAHLPPCAQGEQGSLFGSEGVGSQHIEQGAPLLLPCYLLISFYPHRPSA